MKWELQTNGHLMRPLLPELNIGIIHSRLAHQQHDVILFAEICHGMNLHEFILNQQAHTYLHLETTFVMHSDCRMYNILKRPRRVITDDV